MKNLQIEDTITLKNGDEEKTYKVIGRNNDVQNPPEYTFENTETGEFLKNEHELLVLCPGILPPKDLKELAANLGLEVHVDGFIPIKYPASNPVDTTVPGVFVAGCAESAKDIPDSVAAGSAAAMRASIVLARGGEL